MHSGEDARSLILLSILQKLVKVTIKSYLFKEFFFKRFKIYFFKFRQFKSKVGTVGEVIG